MLFCNFWPFRKKEKTPNGNPRQSKDKGSGSHAEEKATGIIKEEVVMTNEPSIELVARDVWNRAYDDLKNDDTQRELMEEYEGLLKKMLDEGDPGSRSSVIEQFADLSKDNRERVFNALIQEGVEKTEKSADVRKTMNIISSCIQKTQSVASSALSAYPPASIAWGVTCLLLGPVFTNTSEQIDSRQSGLKYVISRFPWYARLIDLLNSDTWTTPATLEGLRESVQEQIISLYTKLIDYQLQSFRSYHHPVSTFGKNIVKWDDWDDMIKSIKDTEAQLEKYISAYTTSATQETFRKMASALKEQTDLLAYIGRSTERQTTLLEDQQRAMAIRRKENLKLKFKPERAHLDLEIYEQYVNQLASPYNGTGKGVLELPKFTTWADNDDGLLVLAAHPGTGKSVLAKYLVERMSQPGSATVCSFFFKDNNNKGQNKPRVALSKILYEAIKNCDVVTETVERKTHRLDSHEIHPSSSAYWDLLDSVTRSTPSGRLIIVIDALDECDSKYILSLVQALRNYRTSKMKILLTTRPVPNILETFKDSILNMDDDPGCRKFIKRDIIKVSKQRLKKFAEGKEIGEATKQVFLDRVTAGNDRTYLYVESMFKYLEQQGRQRNSKSWDQRFRESPTDLQKAYAALLNGVNAAHRAEVRRMLEIVMAATRPLNLREMEIALALHDDNEGCETEGDLCSSSTSTFKDWVLEVCGFFLDIYNERIYFIHLSAKEHLLSGADRPTWLDGFTMESCHRTLTTSCLTYFQTPFVRDAGFMNINKFTKADRETQRLCIDKCSSLSLFGEYAFSQWIVHSKASLTVECHRKMNVFARIHDVYPKYPLDLAMGIFCYSRLASEIEARVFVDALPSKYPARIEMISRLVKSFYVRGGSGLSGLSEVSYALELAREAVDQTPKGSPMIFSRWQGLIVCLFEKGRRTGSVDMYDEAIKIANTMVDVIPFEHYEFSHALHHRGRALLERFIMTHNRAEDLDMAIQDVTRVLQIASEDRYLYPDALNTLSLCFHTRYMDTGEIEDLDRAISKVKESVSLDTKHGQPSVNTLAYLLRTKYKASGNINDLDKAVVEARKAVALPKTNAYTNALRNLAENLEVRFDLTGETNDLNDAVIAAQKTLDETLKDDGFYSKREWNLHRLRDKQEWQKHSN